MKIFGVSLSLILIVLVAYFVGAKWGGPANKVLSAVGA